jgi:hypothetical protein
MNALPRRVASIATVCLACTAAFAAPSAADEGIHACPDAAGNVVYQDGPCPDAPVAPRPARATAATSPPTRSAPARITAPPPRARTVVPVAVPERFSADPLRGSPEKTWRTFLDAMRGGDRDGALSCLAASAKDAYLRRIRDLPKDRLHEVVDAYASYVLEGSAGPFWSIRVIRPGTRPKWILFEKEADGTWRIAAM